MQNYAFIPSLGMAPGDFWAEANDFGREQKMDGILAYMYTMIRKCRELEVPLTRESLVRCGRSISFFPGVLDWFSRIDRFGALLVVGITTLLAVQVFLNISVVTNLLPTTGISLPFFSYGGTALMIQLAEMGMVLSVSRQIPAPKQE